MSVKININTSRELKKELNQLLNTWDFIGVLPFKGGPKDEYDCLITPIFSLMRKGADSDKLTSFLSKELNDHFGIDYKSDELDQIVKKITEWWNSKYRK